MKAVQKAEQLIAQRCRLQTPLVALPPPSYSPHTGVDESRLAFLLTLLNTVVSVGPSRVQLICTIPAQLVPQWRKLPGEAFGCVVRSLLGGVLLAVLLRGYRRRTLGGILHCPVAQQPRYLFSSGEHNMLLFQWLWQPMCASFSPRTTTKAAVPMRRPQTMH